MRVGSTTGNLGPIDGVLDLFDSSVNAMVGRLTVDGGTGAADTLKVYDGGDSSREAGTLTASALTGMGMQGINYSSFVTFGKNMLMSDGWSISPTVGYGVYMQDFHTKHHHNEY